MFRFFAVSLLFLSFNCSAKSLDPFECSNAPISEFIAWVAKSTGKNFVIGSGVNAPVSLNIPSLDESAILTLTKEVLNSNGFQLSYANDIYTVTVKSLELSKIETFPQKPPTPLFTKIFILKNVSNEKIAPILLSHLISSSNQSNAVTPLPNSNSILVTSSKSELDKISELISSIDVQSKMIHIEAVILETTVSNNDFTGANLKSKLLQNGFSFNSTMTSPLGPLISANLLYSVGGDIRGLLASLANDQNSKILSTPNLVIIDRERASISVGQNVPFISSKSVTDGGTALQQIQRRDVGISLTVQPHVLENGSILLSIHQESSSLDNAASAAADIITNTRSLDTSIIIKSGESVMLGGLINEDSKSTSTHVPLLHKIPLVRSLFKSRSRDRSQRELSMVLKANFI